MEHAFPDPSPLTRSEAARVANSYVIELADQLGTRSEARPVAFLCECGCFGLVEATTAGYKQAGGAWLPEHERRPLR